MVSVSGLAGMAFSIILKAGIPQAMQWIQSSFLGARGGCIPTYEVQALFLIIRLVMPNEMKFVFKCDISGMVMVTNLIY